MAVNTIHIDAAPAQVFGILSNGWAYSNWVVGTSHMRAVEADWPVVGSKLFHASGPWPLVMRDETVVELCEPDRKLVLTARARPFGEAIIAIELIEDGTGCTVRMEESPKSGPGNWLHNPASEALLKRRNTEALNRLRAIAENRSVPID